MNPEEGINAFDQTYDGGIGASAGDGGIRPKASHRRRTGAIDHQLTVRRLRGTELKADDTGADWRGSVVLVYSACYHPAGQCRLMASRTARSLEKGSVVSGGPSVQH